MRFGSRTTLALSLFVLGVALARAAESPTVDEPTFRRGSWWVYHITSQSQGRSSDIRMQWTLAYEGVGHQWVFLRTTPDPSLADADSAPGGVQRVLPTPAGSTHTSWDGRDGNGASSGTSIAWVSFPLFVGKTWTETSAPSALAMRHRVVGWEDVQVSGRTFHALRVEARQVPAMGASEGGSAPATETATGLRRVDWYAPEVQNFVRERMDLPDGGVTTFELDAYKLAR